MLASMLGGLVLGAIVSIGFHDDAVETSPARCQDRVVALTSSNRCPHGTFLEVQSDGNGQDFIVCHCEQPIKFEIQLSPPSQQQEEPQGIDPYILPNPEVAPSQGLIEL